MSAYEAEMSRHMTLHEDVIERVLNILKQDDYYRTLEDLPVIDKFMAYDNIKLFPELYDTSTIIERVTTEADLIERQLANFFFLIHSLLCIRLIRRVCVLWGIVVRGLRFETFVRVLRSSRVNFK